MSARRAFAGLLAAAAALGLGCATCRTDEPPVRSSVGGAIGGGSGGFSHSMGVGFDVTNLFCRAPQQAQPAQTPTPGTPPIPDPQTPPAETPPAESDGAGQPASR